MRLRRRRRSAQRGGAFVELALAMTLFITLMWGSLSFAHAVFAYNNVAFLAREGSRWASVRGSSSGQAATPTSVSTYTKTRSAGLDKSKLTVQTGWSDAAKPAGSRVTVTVTYAVQPLPLAIIKTPLTVTGKSTATVLQ